MTASAGRSASRVVEDVAEVGLGGELQRRVARGPGARRACGSGRRPPRRRCRRRACRGRRRRRRPAGAASTCRCRDRRRRGWRRRARGRRRGRGRARRCRRRRAGAAARGGEVAEGEAAAAGPGRGRGRRGGSSTMVFQAPQASQRPAHLARVAPQAVQVKAGRRGSSGDADPRLAQRGRLCGQKERAGARMILCCFPPVGGKRLLSRLACQYETGGPPGGACRGHRTASIGPSARPWMNWSR